LLVKTSTSKGLVSCSDLKLSSFCTSRAAFVVYYISVLKISLQVYSKLVYYTSVHKISLLYKCTQNQLTVQVYTKPLTPASCCLLLPLTASTCFYLECTGTEHYQLPLLLLPASAHLYLPLPTSTCLCLSLPFSTCLCLHLPFSTCLCLSLSASA